MERSCVAGYPPPSPRVFILWRCQIDLTGEETMLATLVGDALQQKLRQWTEQAPSRKSIGFLAHRRCHHLSRRFRISSTPLHHEKKSEIWGCYWNHILLARAVTGTIFILFIDLTCF
ncbi:unnamed protein product [Arabis nemorensis]|uniref:Uncharacterized protein n=1 Tax=Arabis nemorensis TaxID=586526 RepID=A0A565B903_9BRAS|nr:unnamed protein product [Arabis nemorensis]